MILLDADLLLLDIRYPRDVRFGANERLLKTLREQDVERGIILYALLEVIGVLSFNLPTDQIQQLYTLLPGRYGLQVIPALGLDQEAPTFSLSEIIGQVEKKMALGDALQTLYIPFLPFQSSAASLIIRWRTRALIFR